MKLFLAVAMTCLLTSVQAQSGADEKYIAIYGLIQQADNLLNTGEPQDALAAYVDAKGQLEQLQKHFPDWNASIVAFRLNYLDEKISELRPSSAAPGEPAAIAPGTNEAAQAAAKLQAQRDALQAQLQSAQFENQTLQAKLKEALAAQPAAVDADELTQARAQIRWLMKDNDLLKASRTTPPATVAAAPSSEELIDYVRKYSAEHQRAEKLAAEMAALQQSFAKSPAPDSAALAAVRAANEKLRLQIASFRAAATNAPVVEKLSAELADARTQIATLKATVRTVTQQNTALEKQVQDLSDEVKTSADDFAKRIRKLTQERDDLAAQLAVADKKISKGNTAAEVAQITALNDQMNALRARIEVDEAKPTPYTPEELALFQQAAPTPPVTEKKSIQEMPAGSAELVASAQRHFASRQFDAAEADYQKILDRDQNNGLVLANLATIELQQGKLDDAEKHLTAAIAQSPDDAYNLSTLGYLKFRQEKYDDALLALSRAVKIDPNNPEIQNYLGVTLGHKGLRIQAETALRKAIQIDPSYAPAHNNLAVIYLNQTPPLPQLARWHYQKALDAGQPHNLELEKMLKDQGAAVTQ
jgi:Tfp pilus assembly protein PilF/predicted  nucleic acid-binding Zn-ribbon protein